MTIPVLLGELPYGTTAQLIEIDRAMIEDNRIDLVRIMEIAGPALGLEVGHLFAEGDVLRLW